MLEHTVGGLVLRCGDAPGPGLMLHQWSAGPDGAIGAIPVVRVPGSDTRLRLGTTVGALRRGAGTDDIDTLTAVRGGQACGE